MSNPLSAFPTEKQDDIHGLVDQAVVLNTALVPKLPEINVVDGMVPIIDQVYCDSGSQAEFAPNTTINFNFGNHAGKLIDWTQTKINFDAHITCKYIDKQSGADFAPCFCGTKNVRCVLRDGAMVFSQVTLGGAGRPLTVNDYEMVALSKHLLTTCESNVRSRIGEISCYNFPGCGVALTDLYDGWDDQDGNKKPKPYKGKKSIEKTYVIPVSLPVTSVLPQFQGVDNYLNSVTTGLELRLSVSSNPGIFSFIAPETVDAVNPTKGWFGTSVGERITNMFFYNHFRENGVEFEGGQNEPHGAYPTKDQCTHRLEVTLNCLKNVRIDMISTQHPDDTIVQMLTNIAMTRGLFYHYQMNICTPFNFTAAKGGGHYSCMVPVVSGYNNIDTIFVWFTTKGEYTKLRKLPIKNLYTSLNGSYKTPVHQYRDEIVQPMVECAHQFNRAFGTVNSTILSPLHEIMQAYMPQRDTENLKYIYPQASDWKNGEIGGEARTKYLIKAAEIEYALSDSFVTNSCVWELEKTAWMSNKYPDFANYANKYQIVFDLEPMAEVKPETEQKDRYIDLTMWVCQRCDCYTHIKNGYLSVLTSKREVALALQGAQ